MRFTRAAASAVWSSVILAATAGGAAHASQDLLVSPGLPEPVDSGFFDVPQGRIFYEVFGAGSPIVLIHDGLAHREVWDAQVSAFASGYRVIRYDRRGYGRSDPPAAPYSNLDDLHALLTGLDVAPAVIVGSSSGGGLAIDYAIAHPERVAALVLCGPVVSGLGYSFHFMKRAYDNQGPDRETLIENWIQDRYAVVPGNDAARSRLRDLLEACPHNFDSAKHQLALDTNEPERFNRVILEFLGEQP